MGFEPTTFCMASSAWGRGAHTKCLHRRTLRRERGIAGVQEFASISGRLGTERGPVYQTVRGAFERRGHRAWMSLGLTWVPSTRCTGLDGCR
jgi:hypothetical protein